MVSNPLQQGEFSSSIASAKMKNSNEVGAVGTLVKSGTLPTKKSCVHNKKGRCKEHGDGARKHFKLIITKEEGPNGKIVRKLTKKMYWVCDLEPIGLKKVTQTKLSFTRTPQRVARGDKGGDDDTEQGNLGQVLTSTEGQNGQCGDVQTGSDEK